jgi:hypothetical protein
MEMHVGGKACLPHPVPDALAAMAIMIAGDHMPVDARKATHAFQRFQQGLGGGGLVVIEVARDQHMPGGFLCREAANLLDGGQARLTQHAFLFAEVPERLADLPVRCVNDPHASEMKLRDENVKRTEAAPRFRKGVSDFTGDCVRRFPYDGRSKEARNSCHCS